MDNGEQDLVLRLRDPKRRDSWLDKEAAAEEIERLRLALARYGSHDSKTCMTHINGTCYCGWDELKTELMRLAYSG